MTNQKCKEAKLYPKYDDIPYSDLDYRVRVSPTPEGYEIVCEKELFYCDVRVKLVEDYMSYSTIIMVRFDCDVDGIKKSFEMSSSHDRGYINNDRLCGIIEPKSISDVVRQIILTFVAGYDDDSKLGEEIRHAVKRKRLQEIVPIDKQKQDKIRSAM